VSDIRPIRGWTTDDVRDEVPARLRDYSRVCVGVADADLGDLARDLSAMADEIERRLAGVTSPRPAAAPGLAGRG
jgi:hypothetical protein